MQKIQSYEIIEKIGIGGMGTVYKVRHDFKKSIFAIKSLHPQFAQSDEIKERFKNEAKILSHLEHENIVKVEDFIEDATGLHIIMEYVEGRTLDRMIGQEVGPIPYKRALPMFVQILKGIGFAHQKGIIHRDIKPSNIIVTPNNKIKIADFGIAKIGGEGIHTKTGTKMGTLLYMSPEQLKGEKVDERSDIYSLGVTLYEMLAGKHPLRTNEEISEYTLMTRILTEEFPSPKDYYPHIPQKLVKIVFRAICKNKEDRTKSIAQFQSDIQEANFDLDGNYSYLEATEIVPTKNEITYERKLVSNKPEISKPLPAFKVNKVENRNKKPNRTSIFVVILVVAGIIGVLAMLNIIPLFQEKKNEMIFIEGGTFEMGSNTGDPDEKPTHNVTLSSFYVSKYEVTVGQYKAYCKATGKNMPQEPSWGWRNSDPILNVSWDEAQGYCSWAGVRLLTEAEWEYAAKGGNKSKGYTYSGSNNVKDVGWSKDNSEEQVHTVGSKNANELGLYDMTGNVWEWCVDGYDENYYYFSESQNPSGPAGITKVRVLRGGSWDVIDNSCRVTNRGKKIPDISSGFNGFRVAHN